MILSKSAQRQDGNFLVIVSFIATAFVLFFALFSYIAKSYLSGQEDSKITTQAEYAAESILEQLPYEYNQNSPLSPAKTILHAKEKFCRNFSFHLFDSNTNQAIIDFGPACNGDGTITEIGDGRSSILKFASRMTEEETAYLDRYQLFEYRLTRSEFLEMLKEEVFQRPEKLAVTWWNDKNTVEKNPKIEFILASWEEENDGKMNSNISVHRIIPKENNIQFDSKTGKNVFEITDFSQNSSAPLFCNTNCDGIKPKEYILFIKSFYQPLHISIRGFPKLDDTDEKLNTRKQLAHKEYEKAIASGNAEDIQDKEAIFFREAFKIPSRNLQLEASSIIENEQNPLEDFVKTSKAQKQIYTDFDSNFPYVKYEIR